MWAETKNRIVTIRRPDGETARSDMEKFHSLTLAATSPGLVGLSRERPFEIFATNPIVGPALAQGLKYERWMAMRSAASGDPTTVIATNRIDSHRNESN